MMQKLGIGLLLAGLLLWCMPGTTMAADCVGWNTDTDCGAIGPDQNCGCDWLETFDTYPDGPLAQGTNFWYGWENDAAVVGFITTAQDHTSGSGKSLRGRFVAGPPAISTDAVHWFLGRDDDGTIRITQPGAEKAGYDSDVSTYWIMEGWIFIPADHVNDSFWILNSWYNRGAAFPDNPAGGTRWHMQYEFNSDLAAVWNSLFGDPPAVPSLPLVKGSWVRLEMQMNFELDTVFMFYDDQFLMGYNWTSTVADPAPDKLFLGNLDLFVNQGSDTFYDDISMVAAEPPQVFPPTLSCVKQSRDDTSGCTTYLLTLRNENLTENIEEWYLDMEAGVGALPGLGACVGLASSTDAITIGNGWTVTNCTNWSSGHALFRFRDGTPIAPLETLQFTMTIDANKSVEINSFTSCAVVPPFVVLASAGQLLGNEANASCATDDFSFGPCFAGPTPSDQKWSQPPTACESFLNAPATSTWAKVVLAMLLVAGGSMLVVRSRRVAA